MARPLPGLPPTPLTAGVVDTLIASGFTAFILAAAAAGSRTSSGLQIVAHLSVALLAGGALAWRRRAPLSVLGIEIAAVLAEGAAGLAQDAALALIVAAYTVATIRSWRVTVVAGSAAAAAAVAGRLAHGGGVASAVVAAAALAAGCAAGLYVSTRRAYAEPLGDHALRVERGARPLADRVVADERARIARELHDVVADHVSVMVVRGGAARETLGAEHALAPTLDALAGSGRQALAEMRRMLGLLRPDTAVEQAPRPGLADLAALAAQVRASGLVVDVVEVGGVAGAPPVTAGVDLFAYRIVEEALTNAIRHGQARHATVTVRRGARALELEIVDDGRGAQAPARADGHGLVGMRERVALYGGSVDAAPRPGGGFAVQARIPLEGAA